jgi:hypothetical protein
MHEKVHSKIWGPSKPGLPWFKPRPTTWLLSLLSICFVACGNNPTAATETKELIGTWTSSTGSIILNADSSLVVDSSAIPVTQKSIWFVNGKQIITILASDYSVLLYKQALDPFTYSGLTWTTTLISYATNAFNYTLEGNTLCLSEAKFNRCFTK